MRISVLTYTVPHRKTYDTLCRLKALGYQDVTVLAYPMTYTKKHSPLIEHRPSVDYLVPDTALSCKHFGYKYEVIDDYTGRDLGDIALVCGAGIIPQDVVDSNTIVNAHPGYIPLARGLDSLKWSILEDLPIGVTTHFLGKEIDAGEVLERREIQVEEGESFYELAMRVYYTEIDMLVGAIEKMNDEHVFLAAGSSAIHRRMPEEQERILLDKYEARKEASRRRSLSMDLWKAE